MKAILILDTPKENPISPKENPISPKENPIIPKVMAQC
jgi:hypothetical protein